VPTPLSAGQGEPERAHPLPVAFIDLETRSTISIRDAGASLYAEHPDTDVWMACWAIGDGPIETWRPGAPAPAPLALHVLAGGIVCAHNAGFERAIWLHILGPRYGWPEPRLEQWDCTAARAAAMALPRKLEDAAKARGLPVRKDKVGHSLMLRMARPRSANGAVTWWDEPAKLERLEAYCRQDVEVERALHAATRPLSASERELFLLDARINERGIAIDLALVAAAQTMVDQTLTVLSAELRALTGGAVTSTSQLPALLGWLNEQGPVHTIANLDKEAIAELLSWNEEDLPAQARRAIEIRAEAAKTSTAKLRAFRTRACADGRIRDNLMFHGAATGRWAGRGAQLQNLPRSALIKDQDAAIALIMKGEVAKLGPPLTVVSEILRGVLVAAPGHELLAADFNAIEARVLAWLAGEQELIQQFAAGVCPYRRMAGKIYRLPVETADALDKDDRKRWIGKTVVLGAGYQMGTKRFRAECAKKGVALSAAEAEHIIATYRGANPRIVELWRELERAARQAVDQRGALVPAAAGRLRFRAHRGFLWLELPSKRLLAYPRPRIEEREAPWGEPHLIVTYEGKSRFTLQWGREQAYGGRWTENVVQAIARDLMAEGMLRLERAGYPITMTVHDEVISEVVAGFGSVAEFEKLLSTTPPWAAGCPVKAEGWRGKRYRK
jgi:DNA polymerase